MRAVDVIADRMKQPNATRLRTAVLTAFASGKGTITLAGNSIPNVPYLASYTPTVNDKVMVLQTSDGSLLILGKPA